MFSTRPAPPSALLSLLSAGLWPSTPEAAHRLRIPPEKVHAIHPTEHEILLTPPPFHTLAEDIAASPEFWQTHGALHQLTPEKTLLIADFAIGADTCLLLDFAQSHTDPPVLYLDWTPDKRNRWIQVAANITDLAALLGLTRAH